MKRRSNLTFKEYFKLTKETTKNIILISGLIFSIIFLAIAITVLITHKNEIISRTDLIILFVTSIILGNLLGTFIWILAIISSYTQIGLVITFYLSIPESEREKYGLELVLKYKNPKYEYPQAKIISNTSEIPFFINLYKKDILVTIFNDISRIDNFARKVLEINRKYKNNKVSLTAWGLQKTIRLKKWEKLSNKKIEKYLLELKNISEKENFIIRNY